MGRLAPRIAGLLGPGRARPAGLLKLDDDELVAALGGGRAGSLRSWLDAFDAERARREVHRARLDCVCMHSTGYPAPLLDLPDPPAVLYVAGGTGHLATLLRGPAVTIVGGRRATPYALEVAATLGRGLDAAGVTVVSGLALGVDGAAHRGATEAGDRAVAVLASGPDLPHPRSNRVLYERLRARGAVVSELPPGVAPARWSFPARNRIMAALGVMTVVVEAADRSGSLITAAFAADLGREVGAVPGRVTAAHAAGSNCLLRDGARVIRGPADVLDEIFGAGRGPTGAGPTGAPPTDGRADAVGAELDPPLRRVLEAVEAGHRADAIGREARLPPPEVRAALGRLELLGLVARDALGHYERSASPWPG